MKIRQIFKTLKSLFNGKQKRKVKSAGQKLTSSYKSYNISFDDFPERKYKPPEETFRFLERSPLDECENEDTEPVYYNLIYNTFPHLSDVNFKLEVNESNFYEPIMIL